MSGVNIIQKILHFRHLWMFSFENLKSSQLVSEIEQKSPEESCIEIKWCVEEHAVLLWIYLLLMLRASDAVRQEATL